MFVKIGLITEKNGAILAAKRQRRGDIWRLQDRVCQFGDSRRLRF